MMKKRCLGLFFLSTTAFLFFLISTGFAQTPAKPVTSESDVRTNPQSIKLLSPNENKTVKKQASSQENKIVNKNATRSMKERIAELPDNSDLPDLIIDKFELVPKYAILGEPYALKIWFKEYPRLAKSPRVEVLKENLFAPALLRSTRLFSIPTEWKSYSPGITINYDAEKLIDMKVQQKKRLTITLDINNDIAEKNEGNNIITHDFGLYPANTKMADLMFYDHLIKKLASEKQYYFKSESPNFEKHVHQPVKIWGYVVNFGNDTARPFKIRIKGDLNRDLKTKFSKVIQVNKLVKPNEIYTFHVYMTWPTPGLKVCLFELDIDDEVIESNEDNNTSVGTCTLRIAE